MDDIIPNLPHFSLPKMNLTSSSMFLLVHDPDFDFFSKEKKKKKGCYRDLLIESSWTITDRYLLARVALVEINILAVADSCFSCLYGKMSKDLKHQLFGLCRF